ncbi:hypothetical protein OP10G_3872 [Fimbriimonas ginsengisoli Gsoil 348]|uniref:DinB-like domain-containing protein n=2 Tax=Fimbriimonas ginsengisoli TaxID=1005039 RepID=A0A068NWT5_FIMGI|nr:hypothetical protein OP10G_3872 [Fimbriimonas ginsengisoli Gsoil 348]
MSIKGMQDWFSGQPFPFDKISDLDAWSRAKEKEFTSREQVMGLLEENSNAYLAWLDSLTPEQLASTLDMGFASFPMAMAITFPADHTRAHASQIDYIQTTYGDLDWHMAG